jgi:pseudouridine synthase
MKPPRPGGPKAPPKASDAKAQPRRSGTPPKPGPAKPPRRPATAKPSLRPDAVKAPPAAKAPRRAGAGTSSRQPAEKQKRYIAFHKPWGVLSQFSGAPRGATLGGFGLPTGVYAAGRLDRDSEGLLLLSNDGPFIARLLDPAHTHPRTYLVQVEGIPDRAAIDRLRAGVTIGDYRTLPCRAESIEDPGFAERDPPIRKRKWIPTSWIRTVLIEGKNRQVRHMTAAVGFPTLRLVRVAIGDLTLGDLAPGAWRPVARAAIGIG